MIEALQVVELPPQMLATIHIETPRSEMHLVMRPGISEAMAAAHGQGVGPAGPWFAHHLKMSSESFDFGICVPVSAPVTAVGRVKPWQRPALKMVRTIYHGGYDGLGGAWLEFDEKLETSGYKTVDDLYECYLVGPESSSDPADWRTELSRSIAE